MKLLKFIMLVFATAVILTACGNDDIGAEKQFGIFTVLDDNKTVEMDGDIRTQTLDNFEQLQVNYPNIKTINIKDCGGSLDDETNLKLALKIHQSGINTHLMDNAEIASGGVDFFLAGIKRTRGTKTKIGVHSWGGDGENATDYPVGHKYHLPYIEYYQAVGFSQKQAEDFYYFTINSASAEGIHWMTDAEIEKYRLVTIGY